MKLSIMALSRTETSQVGERRARAGLGSGIGVDTHKHLLKVFRLYFTVIDTDTGWS